MELDKLRPEVREAVHAIDHGNGVFVDSDDSIGAEKWSIVLAELLRLADECDELRTAYTSASQSRNHWRECVGRAEAELAALKARIANSCRADGQRVFDLLGLPIEYDGTLALVKVEG